MLTWTERLMLWNQYEILKELQPHDANTFEEKRRKLEGGYEQFCDEVHLLIDKSSVSEAETTELAEILDMFRAIHFACERNNYTPKSPRARFDGFDGNSEHPQYGIANFLREFNASGRN